ncbi:head-tail adaptor protein [Schinkia azotoformans]|uniref:head-tail adaptor protein n=1 Tax=Schinkia azotoformans TaxID=1454 RepID=UPI002DB5F887|nr:head-tail adaptor protein [Schinkia azotoformans]MEC1722223.1 head-tail adaptor protein [Schinkia azotoformans]MED4412415.1 head-tail adaptor protein [Schinkia azotoformans]
MSLGKMNVQIEIFSIVSVKDEEGFATEGEQLLTSVRAYKENRHGSEAWKNRASFSEASSLFRFRKPRGFELTTDLVIGCKDERYNILSVEDIKERGMYVEVLAEKITGSKG